MYIDYKSSVWSRIKAPDEKTSKEMLEFLRNGGSIDELFDEFGYELDTKVLDDTAEYMTVRQNEGNPTIEVLDSSFDTIWDNQDN